MSDDTKEPKRERAEGPSLPEGVIAAASEGFIVAAISAVAYIFAFVYEAGFARVFSIPVSFIAINLTSVLVVAGSLLLVGQFMFNVGTVVFAIFHNINGPISRRVKLLIPYFLVSVALIYLSAGTRLLSIFIIVLFLGLLVLIFFQFIFPLLTQRDKGSYEEKLGGSPKKLYHLELCLL